MLPSLLFGFLFVLEIPFTKPRELHPLRETDRSEKTALSEKESESTRFNLKIQTTCRHPTPFCHT